MRGRLLSWFYLASVGLWSCTPTHDQNALDTFTKDQLNRWNHNLTNVIIKDIFTPPVASRIYAYCNIAAYETIASSENAYVSLAGQLNQLSDTPLPTDPESIDFPIASIMAFSTVGRSLVFDSDAMQEYEIQFLETLDEIGIDPDIKQQSIQYGQEVARHILKWAAQDGYKQREALPKYVLLNDPGKWEPTPPDYMPGIEPHWHTLRPFVIDSASQFTPPPPTEFDTTRSSQFFKEAMEVYDAVVKATEEETEIAKFWDCNPNISYTKGHVMFYTQKISPGGHWISIAGIAAKKAYLPLIERAHIFALTSIALADAFISCWDEKYRSSLIRPETFINRYYDESWHPILQTPAFPEYTSGHSVISRAAAETLTHMLGDNFSFVDSTEVEFGLPVRSFDSFFDASDEAAISRLYGGIHYLPACVNGVEQGKKVGKHVIRNLQFQLNDLASQDSRELESLPNN